MLLTLEPHKVLPLQWLSKDFWIEPYTLYCFFKVLMSNCEAATSTLIIQCLKRLIYEDLMSKLAHGSLLLRGCFLGVPQEFISPVPRLHPTTAGFETPGLDMSVGQGEVSEGLCFEEGLSLEGTSRGESDVEREGWFGNRTISNRSFGGCLRHFSRPSCKPHISSKPCTPPLSPTATTLLLSSKRASLAVKNYLFSPLKSLVLASITIINFYN